MLSALNRMDTYSALGAIPGPMPGRCFRYMGDWATTIDKTPPARYLKANIGIDDRQGQRQSKKIIISFQENVAS